VSRWSEWRQRAADREYAKRERWLDRCARCRMERVDHVGLVRKVDACKRFKEEGT
jgi:hypothetical protein